LVDLLKNYLKTQFELVKLDIQERLEALLERIFKFIILAFAIGIGILFLLHGIANMINAYLNSQFWGHVIVSGACFIVGGIMAASFRQPVEKLNQRKKLRKMSDLTEKKLKLEAEAANYEDKIGESIADIKQVAKEKGTQILVAGAVVAGAYLLYSLLSDNKSEKKSDKKNPLFRECYYLLCGWHCLVSRERSIS